MDRGARSLNGFSSRLLRTIVLAALFAITNSADYQQCNVHPLPESRFLAFNCANLGLTHVPLVFYAEDPISPYGVQILDLQDNKIESVRGTLGNFTSLQALNLSGNHLTALEKPALDSLASLLQLDLSRNAIPTLGSGVFLDLTNITNVSLAHNRITQLDSDALDGLQTIQILNLSNNHLTEIDQDVFLNFSNLEVLDLSYNNLHSLPGDLFSSLHSLRQLFLQHNLLENLPSSLLPGLPSLATLDLSFNLLVTIGQYISDLCKLIRLDLSQNQLQEIQAGFLDGMHILTHLYMDGNNLTTFDIPLLRNQRRLQVLSVAEMPVLSYLPYNAFHGLDSLTQVNLSHNPELSFVHPHLFSQLPAVQVIDLRNNNISLLSAITFHGLSNLHQVWLGSNPLQCLCQLAWLAKDIHHNASIYADASVLSCSTDNGTMISLQGSFYFQLLTCPQVGDINATELVWFHIGSSARLFCHYDNDPATVLIWVTPHHHILTYHAFHADAISHLVEPNDTNKGGPFHQGHYWHNSRSYFSELYSHPDHMLVLSDGSLYIDYVLRGDSGPYHCMAYNAHYNNSATIILKLDHSYMFSIKIMSLVVGVSVATSFLILTCIYGIISLATRRLVNKRRRKAIRQLLENIDTYRSSQVTKMRENCNTQLGKIRETYHQQVDRLRDNYGAQVKRVRKGYSHQVERIRDNYNIQFDRLRGYSGHQIEQIREAYNSQLLRMRDYGSLQLERLREKYKLQHQHVLKLLETMNIDNCRTVIESECMRTESMLFESELFASPEDFPPSPKHSSDSEGEYVTAANSTASSQESVISNLEEHALDIPELFNSDEDLDYPPPPLPSNQHQFTVEIQGTNWEVLPVIIDIRTVDAESKTSTESDETLL